MVHLLNRLRWEPMILIVLLLIGNLGGCGGESRFEFVVRDQGGNPLSGVTVFYFDASKDSVNVGNTGQDGSIVISDDELQLNT